jgi:hypothetical protein
MCDHTLELVSERLGCIDLVVGEVKNHRIVMPMHILAFHAVVIEIAHAQRTHEMGGRSLDKIVVFMLCIQLATGTAPMNASVRPVASG